MNTVFTAHATAPAAPRRDETVARRVDAADGQRARDFERLLREKSRKHDDDDDAPADASGTAAVPAFVVTPTPLPPKRSGGDGDAGSDGLGGAAGSAARAARQAAFDADPGQAQPLAPQAAIGAGAWDLTLRQPLAAAVDVRATRNAEAINGWSLSIGSPTLDASVLARHAPRLNERLKARALSDTHARIEESDAEEQP